MVLLLGTALILGQAIVLAVLWPYGTVIAFAGTPFGGILLTLSAGLLLKFLQARMKAKRSIEIRQESLQQVGPIEPSSYPRL